MRYSRNNARVFDNINITRAYSSATITYVLMKELWNNYRRVFAAIPAGISLRFASIKAARNSKEAKNAGNKYSDIQQSILIFSKNYWGEHCFLRAAQLWFSCCGT
jgi:hypothetical protein